MEWKKEILIDLYDLELSLNYETKEIIWNVTDSIALTLKPNCEVLETRYIFNPSFSTFPLGRRITSFQNMWKPDQNSFPVFTCLLNHLKHNTLSCGHLSICGDLIKTLATSGTEISLLLLPVDPCLHTQMAWKASTFPFYIVIVLIANDHYLIYY